MSEEKKYVLGYYYDSDDPYKVLAADLAGFYTDDLIEEMIDNEAVLLSEARQSIIENIDLSSNYGDWVMDLMLRHHKRRLKELSTEFADGLLECMDIKRLQKEIKNYYYLSKE